MTTFQNEILIDSALENKGVSVRIPVLRIADCKILKNEYDLSNSIESVHSELTERFTDEQIKTSEIVQKYRNFSWHFLNIDPTKNRPSGEALARRLLKTHKFPKINPFVDAYNLISAKTFLSLSGYDLEKIKEPLTLRLAKKNEKFSAIGNIDIILEGNEFVISDSENRLLTQYLYRDSEHTKIANNTSKIIFVVNAVNHIDISLSLNALNLLKTLLNELCEKGIVSFCEFV